MTVNKSGSERRFEVVAEIIRSFNGKVQTATPLAYFENCPFPFNNFIYLVKLEKTISTNFTGNQPGTSAAPDGGVDSVVVRLSNLKADGLNNANRVQNEVVCSILAKEALTSVDLGHLVPKIYAWSGPKSLDDTDEANFGWIVSEYKKGADLDGQFPSLTSHEQQKVLETIARITLALQRVPLPPSASQFGGLAFDENGNIVSSQGALLPDGPWASYADVWASKLQSQLAEALIKPALDGWKEQNVASRIEKFIASGGLRSFLDPVDVYRRSLVHGDLTMNNLLYDAETKQLTGLVDFDWSSVTHPIEEYFSGFHDIGYSLSGNPDQILSAVVANDFSTKPEGPSEEDEQRWQTAKSWNTFATQHQIVLPSDVAGVKELIALYNFHSSLCPFQLCNAVVVKSLSDEAKTAKKQESLAIIIPFLEQRGF
ncbi:hypothetical protein VHEMI04130 [[Torrubiella] hemipterigena]|uniref:Aminoglycoside phosphotransferase domain-containing protein n=1 Tax=[Torrubiella] hemipterigena TaxID=1531966 RepID=A0A0A1T0G8_9HYPO|nr:hypothetical protein VHEMI04130 [[Torrubiella] hemipterigena]CEJ86529.1 hypothetical protein VHEMI04130 [[Torrubiella] hemipterigena]